MMLRAAMGSGAWLCFGLISLSIAPLISAVDHGHVETIAPKVLIVNLYDQEGESFLGLPEFNLLEQNITVPGLSPFFPDIHCTCDGSICQLIAGEGLINAAVSTASLIASPQFNLSKTYWLIAGVGGVNPKVGSIGSVNFARFAVQVDLQYEWDTRELPDNYTTGYIPLGTMDPASYPTEIYGTEVFELNEALRDNAIEIVKAANVQLNDTADAAAYRAIWDQASDNAYAAAAAPPSVIACDVVTSDVYWEGALLNDAFANYTHLITNGSGLYCNSAQEDNAILEAILRGNLAQNRTDLSRVILMRTDSDYQRAPPGISTTDNAFYGQAGYVPALANLPIAGVPVVQTIVQQWEQLYKVGVPAKNYVGDILGSLGGTPDFGAGPVPEPEELQLLQRRKRSVGGKKAGRSLKGPRDARTRHLPSMKLY